VEEERTACGNGRSDKRSHQIYEEIKGIEKNGTNKINNRLILLVFSKTYIFRMFARSHFIQNSAQNVEIFSKF
jgi:hypothetical protein